MEWIICFLVNWSLFIIVKGWKWGEFKVNIWCGIFSVIIQTGIDAIRIYLGFYKVTNPIISIWGSSFFFIFGPVLGEGILLSMFQPTKTWARIVHVIWYTAVFTVAEYLVLKTGALVYINWSMPASISINFLAMATLSWFAIVILKKGSKAV